MITSARACLGWLLLLPLLSAGCVEAEPRVMAARRAFEPFQMAVYPVLLRDCGFPACHGAPERFFRVYGPGRTRLPLKSTGLPPPALELAHGDEAYLTWQLAQSMIDERDLSRSLLLRKPLAVEAGGAGHMGIDNYGREVYRTAQDSGFLTIARWVYGPRLPPPMTAPMTAPPAMP